MVHLLPGFKMPLLTLAVFLSRVPWTEESEGRPQLIGSSEPIRAPVGGDVILPCVVQPQINMEGDDGDVVEARHPCGPKLVLWRLDYHSITLRHDVYVHLHHENQHQEAQTMPSYVGRTEMFADGLKLGNVSLRIRNLKPSDDGRYRCIIPHLALATTVKLEVFEPISDDTLTTTQFPGNLQTPDPKNETDVKVGQHNWSSWQLVLSFCVLVVVAGGVGGCFLKHKYQRRHLPDYKPPPPSPAEYVVIRLSDVGFRPASRLETSGPTGETTS
ncbi:Myelin-oligodendrocyte glycoprotein [Dissostichus eleginoides]|uniref:Myelin-oligodendrocyte glycoprotein n=1 Tax=Dissostichus eleginoides TaxID=100907 RepID=A0AAD9F293_DISEL|nr:Myelin-oligodendrocyte glycoprotein [Dissostichus eleginoides]